MKILAVDDDPATLLVVEDALASLGHEVVTASDGDEAWERLKSEGCRIVVSDWCMPRLPGLELCARIRAMPGEYVYFILLTHASATEENRDQAMQAGVDDFLSKPVMMDELKMRLHVAARILHQTTRIQKLESLIPICSYCKSVRDDKSYWQRIEAYLAERTGAGCSHAICPECYKKHIVPQLEALNVKNIPAELKPNAPRVSRA